MSTQQQQIVNLHDVVKTLKTHPKHWIIPAVVISVLVGIYAFVRPDTWAASQAMIVRNEAIDSDEGLGKFGHSDQMKTIQETIFELARSRGVLRAALLEVGPPVDVEVGESWPTDQDIFDIRENVKLTPPNGTEFGTTEVFYLQASTNQKQRAVALTTAICEQLEARFQKLRDTQAQSMIVELTKAKNIAKADLDRATIELGLTEKKVGSDLSELRILQNTATGDSGLNRMVTEIQKELREVRAAQQSNSELLKVLKESPKDVENLVTMPNRLLTAQPSLRRLKDGLVDAQLQTAQLRGGMSQEHPIVIAAQESEKVIRQHIRNELSVATRSVEADLQLNNKRIALLQSRLQVHKDRLANLASLRTTYANQVSEMKNRAELLERAERNLAEARTSQARAKAASLIARIDTPDTGVNPVGPRKSLILLAGVFGGLVCGIGLLLLTVQPIQVAPASAAGDTNEVPSELSAEVVPTFDEDLYDFSPAPVSGLSLKEALETLANV